jgi:hypothetical protein
MPQCRHNHGSCDVEQTAKTKKIIRALMSLSANSQNIESTMYTLIDGSKMVLIIRDVDT